MTRRARSADMPPEVPHLVIGKIEDGRWCGVIAVNHRGGSKTVLSVHAGRNRDEVAAEMERRMIDKPWETRQ